MAEDFEVWQPLDNGATVGQSGTEGVVVRDVEHEFGARATLERDGGTAPWAVTCGVYGWFCHTRFAGTEAEAEFPDMLDGLAAILDGIPRVDDPDAEAKAGGVGAAIARFVARFP